MRRRFVKLARNSKSPIAEAAVRHIAQLYAIEAMVRGSSLDIRLAARKEHSQPIVAALKPLRVAMQTLKEMIFGKRSERLAALVAEQLALELDDLETGVISPAPANDDAVATKPAGKPRKKARRNIGALPKHLPRCEQVLEPDATACPCCEGRLHKIGEDVSEVLDVIPAILRVLRTIRPKYACRGCTDGVVQAKVLPRLERHGLDGTRDPRGGVEVCLVSAAVSAGADSGRPGHSSRPRDAGRLGEACRMVAQEPL
nr:IS66 family transposase zinc-finger binding domain-containing protein [Bradyrhizobium cosmicum]